MTMLLDYSGGKISGAAIKAAGYAGSIRYITDRNSLGTKHTSPAEYADHIANGLQVFLVYEVGTDDALGGFSGGVTAAQRALDGANYIGYPGNLPIFLAFDRHVSTTNYDAEIAAWRAYLDGGASVLGIGRTGAYGFSEALSAAQGHATSFWQCGSHSSLLGSTNFYQRNTGGTTVGGVACDINDVLIAPNTQNGGFLMALTDAQQQQLYDWVSGLYSDASETYLATGKSTTQGKAIAFMFQTLANTPDTNGDGKQGDLSLVNFRQFLVDKLNEIDSLIKAQAANPSVSADAVKQAVTDAVSQHMQITGTVQVTGH